MRVPRRWLQAAGSTVAALTLLSGGLAGAASQSSPLTTVYIQMWSGPEGTAMQTAVNYWDAHFEHRTHIKVVETQLGRVGYHSKIVSELLSKSPTPDIVYPFNFDIPRLAKAGTLVNLDRFVKTDKLINVSDFFPVAWKEGQYNGHQYGIPMDMSEPVLFYRKDLLKTPPNTWNQFLKDAAHFTRSINPKSPTLYGTTLYAATGFAEPMQLWDEILWPYGGHLFNAQGLPTLDSPAGIKATEVGRTLVKDHEVPPDYQTYEYPQVLAALQSGAVAFAQEWNAAWPSLIDCSQSKYCHDFAYAPIPGVRQKDGKVVRYYHVHTINLAINAASKHIAAAYRVVRWLSSTQGGIIYTVAGGNTPRKSVFFSKAVAKVRPGYMNFLATQVDRHGKHEPPLLDMTTIDLVIMNADLNAAWSGQLSPAAALKKGDAQITALLKKDGEIK